MKQRRRLNIKIPKALTIIISIISMTIGVAFLVFPETSLSTLCLILGILTVIYGLAKIIGYYSDDAFCLAFQFDLALGALALIFGIILIVRPKYIISFFPVLMGIAILISGLFTFQTSRESKIFGIKYWIVLTLVSILCVGIGLVLIFSPFKSAIAMTSVVGASIILSGIERLTVALLTVKNRKKAKIDESGFIEVDFKDVEGESND